MIQVGSFLKNVDNCGARDVLCIKILKGYKKRYASVGDLILISVKKLRSKRRAFSRTKQGAIHKALIIKTKIKLKKFNGDSLSFFENSVVLLNKQYKLVGTRIFGLVPKQIRYTKFLRITALSSGITF